MFTERRFARPSRSRWSLAFAVRRSPGPAPVPRWGRSMGRLAHDGAGDSEGRRVHRRAVQPQRRTQACVRGRSQRRWAPAERDVFVRETDVSGDGATDSTDLAIRIGEWGAEM